VAAIAVAVIFSVVIGFAVYAIAWKTDLATFTRTG
jgi:hypothetical protein